MKWLTHRRDELSSLELKPKGKDLPACLAAGENILRKAVTEPGPPDSQMPLRQSSQGNVFPTSYFNAVSDPRWDCLW